MMVDTFPRLGIQNGTARRRCGPGELYSRISRDGLWTERMAEKDNATGPCFLATRADAK